MGAWMPIPSERKGVRPSSRPAEPLKRTGGTCASLTEEQQEQQDRRIAYLREKVERRMGKVKTDEELRQLERAVMPVGKHRGKMFDNIPLVYLHQQLVQRARLPPALRAQMRAYLEYPVIAAELARELEDER